MLRRPLASLLPLAAVVTFATWCSRAVLDLVPGDTSPVRVALLPPALTILPIAAVVVGGLWTWLLVASRMARRGAVARGERERRLAPGHVLWPLYALGLLVVPYLPVAADAIPLLRAFAGPLGSVLWAVCVAAAVFSTARWVRGERVGDTPSEDRSHLPPPGWGIPVVLVLLAVVVIGGLSLRLTLTPLMPGGDEPHYLVLAQSIWRDHDLKIQNNHDRGDYRAYYDRQLGPHYLTRGIDQEIYSIHPVGLPILVAPVYALGGYRLVVFALILVGALAAAAMWRFTRRLTGSGTAATLAWTVIVFSVPYIFNSMSVYPEIVGALCVALSVPAGWPGDRGGSDRMGRWFTAGLCVALLPWLATKYAFMAGALGAVLAMRALMPPGEQGVSPLRPDRLSRLAAIAVPGAISLVAWLAFFKWIWGSWSPAAPYGALTQTRAAYLLVGGPGLLFDQEYGLAAYAPITLLAGVGWWHMVRAGGVARRLAGETVLVFLALLAAVGAFRIWWGDAAPGRPIVSGLLLLAIPIAHYWARAARDSSARAWALVLAIGGLAISVAAVTVQNGALVASSRDGISRMLQWLGSTADVWTAAPSYIAHGWPLASAMAIGWLVAFAAATVALGRLGRDESSGTVAWSARLLGAVVAACLVLVVVSATFPIVFGKRMQQAAPLDARSRSALVDGYSSTQRPLAVAFDPFTVTPSSDVVSRVRFRAVPGEWTDPQPLPLLLNMRMSLPAGRYRVALLFSPLPEGQHRLGLRLGRIGGFFRMFEVPAAGSSWSGEFELPIDANFVGFEASRELGAAVRRVDVTPLAVSDAGRRLRTGQVLAARDYGPVALFAHDERSWFEPEGVWTQGGTRASMTLSPQAGGPVAIRLRSATDNTVSLGASGWQTSLTLRPEEPVNVEIPGLEAGRPVAFWIETTKGNVPIEQNPAVRDRRYLGVFVQFPASGATSAPSN